MTLSTEQGFAFWLAVGLSFGAGRWLNRGKEKKALHRCARLAAYRATGAELSRPYFLALLAEMYGKAGQTEEGLTVLAEALAWWTKLGSGTTRRSCIGSRGN